MADRQNSLEILKKKSIFPPPGLLHQWFYPLPDGDGKATDGRQNVVLVDQPVTDKIAYPIVKTADAMERALGPIAASARDEFIQGLAGQFVQQIELVFLELRTLPDFEQMRCDGENSGHARPGAIGRRRRSPATFATDEMMVAIVACSCRSIESASSLN
jgi:hypothetical protein